MFHPPLPPHKQVCVLVLHSVQRFDKPSRPDSHTAYTVSTQPPCVPRQKLLESETHMVFDSSSGRFHLVAILLVLRQPFRQSTRSSTFSKILPILRMLVLSQNACYSFVHTSPSAACFRWWQIAVGRCNLSFACFHPTAKAGTPMAGEFPQS